MIGQADSQIEDTSDAYYEAQHRRFEAFEKRQRIREREQLQFNRYKMKARVDLLRNLPQTQWVSMVAAILAREGDATWQRGRRKLTTMGNDWLRRHLIKEGLEVLRRYDELLPKEGQKDKEKEKEKAKGFAASPASSSPPPSSQPKPVIKLRLFSSAHREATAREAAAKEAARKAASERQRQRQRSRSSSLSSLSDCDPSSPASIAHTPTPSEPSAPSPASAPSPLPLRLKLARPKGGSLQTTLKFEKPTPSPTKPPPQSAPTIRAPRSSTGSASTEASSPRKVRRLSVDSASVTDRRRSLRSQPSKVSFNYVQANSRMLWVSSRTTRQTWPASRPRYSSCSLPIVAPNTQHLPLSSSLSRHLPILSPVPLSLALMIIMFGMYNYNSLLHLLQGACRERILRLLLVHALQLEVEQVEEVLGEPSAEEHEHRDRRQERAERRLRHGAENERLERDV